MTNSLFQLPDELVLTTLTQSFPCREAQIRALATLVHVNKPASPSKYPFSLTDRTTASSRTLSQPRPLRHRSHGKECHNNLAPRTTRVQRTRWGRAAHSTYHRQFDRVHHEPPPLRKRRGQGRLVTTMGPPATTMRDHLPADSGAVQDAQIHTET